MFSEVQICQCIVYTDGGGVRLHRCDKLYITHQHCQHWEDNIFQTWVKRVNKQWFFNLLAGNKRQIIIVVVVVYSGVTSAADHSTLAVNQPGPDLMAICDVVSVWVQWLWRTAAPPQTPVTAPALSARSADTCPPLWPHAVRAKRGLTLQTRAGLLPTGCWLTDKPGRGRQRRKDLETLRPVRVVRRSKGRDLSRWLNALGMGKVVKGWGAGGKRHTNTLIVTSSNVGVAGGTGVANLISKTTN